ncbi:MAG TPA: hypothetical protein VMT16_01375 [Thermoanaerobaculia bacterium]|nr:hypothetical protein [Thermoanaerobaculia bacterium]
MDRRHRELALPALGLALAYLGYLLTITAVDRVGMAEGGVAARWAAALLPLLPLLTVIAPFAVVYRRLDEVERMIHLLAFTTGFTVMLLAALAVARLESFALVDGGSRWIWAAGIGGWLAGLLAAGARYR